MRHLRRSPVSPRVESTLVREVLRHYPIDFQSARIERPAHARGFSGAEIVRVATTGLVPLGSGAIGSEAAFCLRGWPTAGLPERRLRELHRFLQFVDQRAGRVLPVPIADIQGRTLLSAAGRRWQLEPWMPGAADFCDAPTEVRLQSCMHALARIHQAAANYEPSSTGREWFSGKVWAPSPAVCERLRLVDAWTIERSREAAQQLKRDAEADFQEVATTVLDRFWSLHEGLRRELLTMSRVPVALQVCLRDIWHDHVLFTGDNVTGVIDPSAARTESVAADLARLLGSLLGKWNPRWESALDRYESVRPLSEAERALVPVLHRSGALLSGMNWIERRISGNIPEDLLPAVVTRLKRLCDQLEQ